MPKISEGTIALVALIVLAAWLLIGLPIIYLPNANHEGAQSFALLDDLEKYNGAITAIATIFIAIFTIVLARVTGTQARLTKQAIQLTREELVSNYRPRLRVRNIVVTAPNPALVQRIGVFQPNQLVTGQFFVVNVGGTAATIIESHCIVVWNDVDLPMRRPYEGDDGNNAVARIVLQPGQSIPGLFQSEMLMENRATTIGTKIVRGLRLFVMGWIEYKDDRGIMRRTGFCSEFEKRDQFSEGRFYAVDDPDYNYEE